MPTLTIRLDPRDLPNPDADIRYELPDLLKQRSKGAIRPDGYDYDENHVMTLFLEVEDVDEALQLVRRVLATERVLGNLLDGVAIVGSRS